MLFLKIATTKKSTTGVLINIIIHRSGSSSVYHNITISTILILIKYPNELGNVCIERDHSHAID